MPFRAQKKKKKKRGSEAGWCLKGGRTSGRRLNSGGEGWLKKPALPRDRSPRLRQEGALGERVGAAEGGGGHARTHAPRFSPPLRPPMFSPACFRSSCYSSVTQPARVYVLLLLMCGTVRCAACAATQPLARLIRTPLGLPISVRQRLGAHSNERAGCASKQQVS